jgi:hypothetical protein
MSRLRLRAIGLLPAGHLTDAHPDPQRDLLLGHASDVSGPRAARERVIRYAAGLRGQQEGSHNARSQMALGATHHL